MLQWVCVLLLAASALAALDESAVDSQWEQWKTKFSKVYKTPEEEAMRRAIWEKTRKEVEAHNWEEAQGLHSYRKGLNQFSDMTWEEMPHNRVLSGRRPLKSVEGQVPGLPQDWQTAEATD